MKEFEGMNKRKEIPVFLIDDSALISMLEKNKENKGKQLLEKFLMVKKKGGDVKGYCLTASLLRAIWKTNPKTPIKNLQEVLEIIEVIPHNKVDYKDDKKVVELVINFANKISGGVTK